MLYVCGCVAPCPSKTSRVVVCRLVVFTNIYKAFTVEDCNWLYLHYLQIVLVEEEGRIVTAPPLVGRSPPPVLKN